MTYENAVEKIHSLLTFGSRPGLDRMRILLDRLGNPQDRLKFIHIAGTNGKGSVCAMLSSALVAAGYKTGLFISPYITDFRERIQINNCMVSESVLTDAVVKTFPIIEQLREEGTIITEFEYVNALQFYIHANADCDIVVLETGMGGLLDCTNTIKSPLCAVITTIGLDHTAILGDTIEKIAQQKCGIFKPDSMAVTSKQDIRAMKVIESTAREKKIPLESIYMDIDYMERFKDFTVNQERFPDFPEFVKEMKAQHIHLVPIIDAGVKVEEGYDVYEEGIEKGYFCKKENGEYFVAGGWHLQTCL